MATKTTKPKSAPKKTKETSSAPLMAPVYSVDGKKGSEISLPVNIFGLPWNADLVHQVVVSMQANARMGTAHTKDRGEVQGGGRKPWKQKGTGRARHGSTRSPIWVGGGVAHGPRNDKSYAKKINRGMRRVALLTALSRKFRDGEVVFVSDLGIMEPKAAQAKTVLTNLSKIKGLERLAAKKVNGALIATAGHEPAVVKSFGNFRNVVVENISTLNPVSLLSAKYLVVVSPEKAVEMLAGKKA